LLRVHPAHGVCAAVSDWISISGHFHGLFFHSDRSQFVGCLSMCWHIFLKVKCKERIKGLIRPLCKCLVGIISFSPGWVEISETCWPSTLAAELAVLSWSQGGTSTFQTMSSALRAPSLETLISVVQLILSFARSFSSRSPCGSRPLQLISECLERSQKCRTYPL